MTEHRVQITDRSITDKSITIDGYEIGPAVGDIDVHMSPGSRPVVELRLCAPEVTRMDLDHAELVLDDSQRDALIAMGWTPPDESPHCKSNLQPGEVCPGCNAVGEDA